MKKHSVVNKKCEVRQMSDTVLDYSLIITDNQRSDMFDAPEVYSVLILQTENGVTTKYDFLYDVARDKKNAVEILDTLVYNNVMPDNAREVLADIL